MFKLVLQPDKMQNLNISWTCSLWQDTVLGEWLQIRDKSVKSFRIVMLIKNTSKSNCFCMKHKEVMTEAD